ncbi:MAG: ATP-binding protein [Kineosporiaceae bacterium]
MSAGTWHDVDDDALRTLHAGLPADSRSPAAARRIVTAWCEAQGVVPSTVADVELIVSEFVTNAVVHGSGTVQLRVERSLEHLVVTVIDASGAVVERPVKLVDPDCTTGRGLWIAGALAAHQGSYSGEEGTAVWALLPERRSPVEDAGAPGA